MNASFQQRSKENFRASHLAQKATAGTERVEKNIDRILAGKELGEI